MGEIPIGAAKHGLEVEWSQNRLVDDGISEIRGIFVHLVDHFLRHHVLEPTMLISRSCAREVVGEDGTRMVAGWSQAVIQYARDLKTNGWVFWNPAPTIPKKVA